LARRRFFVSDIHGDHAELTGDDARHLARVLRAEAGRLYELSDNRRAYLAEISAVSRDRVTFRILEALAPETAAAAITLYAAVIKFDRFEWLIEKTTELGAARIVPVIAARTEKGLATAAGRRAGRWNKIAHESSQQSRRLRVPEIAPAEPFETALSDPSPHRYFLEEQPGAEPLLRALPTARTPETEAAILTGPEGGWTDIERALAARAGWTPVSLGRPILRAETAAIAALAILSHAWQSSF
jgi:16S rRNA (uracil1498-N3)-methyltransferase